MTATNTTIYLRRRDGSFDPVLRDCIRDRHLFIVQNPDNNRDIPWRLGIAAIAALIPGVYAKSRAAGLKAIDRLQAEIHDWSKIRMREGMVIIPDGHYDAVAPVREKLIKERILWRILTDDEKRIRAHRILEKFESGMAIMPQ